MVGSATRTKKAVDKHSGPLFPPAWTTPCKVVFPFLSVNTNGPNRQNKQVIIELYAKHSKISATLSL